MPVAYIEATAHGNDWAELGKNLARVGICITAIGIGIYLTARFVEYLCN